MPSAGFTPPAAAGVPGDLPPSVEGGEQRCFKHMLVCTGDLEASKLQLHAYGQFISRHYNAASLVQTQRAQQPPEATLAGSASGAAVRRRQQGEAATPPTSVLSQLGNGGSLGAGQEVELKVVFQKRNRDAQASASCSQPALRAGSTCMACSSCPPCLPTNLTPTNAALAAGAPAAECC